MLLCNFRFENIERFKRLGDGASFVIAVSGPLFSKATEACILRTKFNCLPHLGKAKLNYSSIDRWGQLGKIIGNYVDLLQEE